MKRCKVLTKRYSRGKLTSQSQMTTASVCAKPQCRLHQAKMTRAYTWLDICGVSRCFNKYKVLKRTTEVNLRPVKRGECIEYGDQRRIEPEKRGWTYTKMKCCASAS